MLINSADVLVSENGSILFNCFLARFLPYICLTSARINIDNEAWKQGGLSYNNYHREVIKYHICNLINKSIKHPFADTIWVSPTDLDKFELDYKSNQPVNQVEPAIRSFQNMP